MKYNEIERKHKLFLYAIPFYVKESLYAKGKSLATLADALENEDYVSNKWIKQFISTQDYKDVNYANNLVHAYLANAKRKGDNRQPDDLKLEFISETLGIQDNVEYQSDLHTFLKTAAEYKTEITDAKVARYNPIHEFIHSLLDHNLNIGNINKFTMSSDTYEIVTFGNIVFIVMKVGFFNMVLLDPEFKRDLLTNIIQEAFTTYDEAVVLNSGLVSHYLKYVA